MGMILGFIAGSTSGASAMIKINTGSVIWNSSRQSMLHATLSLSRSINAPLEAAVYNGLELHFA